MKHSLAPFLSFEQAVGSISSIKVLLGEKSPWLAAHIELESALLSHRFKDRGGIYRTALLNLIDAVLCLVLG